MYPFAYHRPKTAAEAARLYAESAEPRYLAGGQTLLPAMKQRLLRPSDLIDLSALPGLAFVRVEADAVVIGAATRHATVAADPALRAAIPALAHLAGEIGDPAVRHRGTLGGSLANADPAADYPAAALGLSATIRTTKGAHAADDFFRGMFETALTPGEIVTEVRFPKPQRAAYMKFPNPASRYAIVGVFVAQFADGVRVAVTGAGPSAFRLPAFEAALTRRFDPAALDGLSADPAPLNGDLHASAEYRAHLIGVMARRAVAAALA